MASKIAIDTELGPKGPGAHLTASHGNETAMPLSPTTTSPPSPAAPTDEKSTPAALADGPPDGGLQAWLHVLGSFFLYFNTWGKP